MKNAIIICSLFFVAIGTGFSQESSVGIKGGFNAANTKTDSGFETETRSGFHVGLYAESRFGDVLAIQPELLYSQQGFTETSGNTEREQKLDYINLPIMLKAYLIPGLFIEAGPQVGFAINDTEEFSNGLFEGEVERDPDSFDYGVGFGAGFKLINGIMAGARYNLGLGEIYDDVDFNNRVFQVYIGFEL